VSLRNFQGPLDLLLYLNQREEVDIYNIPILKITESVFEVPRLLKMLDLDLRGFLVMASTLM